MAAPRVDERAARGFVASHFPDVADLARLSEGEWSTAFGFRSAGRALVVRFGAHIEDYAKDEVAASWSAPDLPIPEVIEVGAAFDGAYVVSERKDGVALDDLPPDQFPLILDALFDTLAAMRRVELPGRGFGPWRAQDGRAPHDSWPEYLLSVAGRDDDRLRGWRERLAAVPEADDAFSRGHRQLRGLVDSCPTARGVVHGDLLAGNVLVDDGRVSAVFDWGNSLAGDPLHDIAALCFWSRWHRGIDADRLRTLAAERFEEADLSERVHCYELHTALDALQYQAFAGRRADLDWTTRQTLDLLEP